MSKLQRTVKKWIKTNVREPVYLGEGGVFMWPASPDQRRKVNNHYLVVWIRYEDGTEEFACSCPAVWYNATGEGNIPNTCPHIKGLKEQMDEARLRV